jgi:two-component system, sensor histidine kinase and response regulator
MSRLPLLLLGLLLATSAFCAQTVNIGVLSYKSIEETQKKWEPTAKWLNSQIDGYEFHIKAMNIPEMDRLVSTKRLDFVLTNPEHLAHLHFEHEYTPLATLMTQVGGLPVNKFGGVIFTRHDKEDITKISNLAGKRIAAVDKKSFGGYLAQAWTIYSSGLDASKIEISFVGFPHDRVVTDVLSGAADAGFVRTGVLEALYKNKSVDPTKIKIINPQKQQGFPQLLSTQLYPEWAFATRPDNNQALIKQVASALFEILPKTECAVLGEYYGFTPPADYQEVEALMVKLGELPMSREFGVKDVLVKYSTLAILLLLLLLLTGAPLFVKLYTSNAKLKTALVKADALGLRDILLESLSEGVISTSKEHFCTYINHAALVMLQTTKEAVIGKHICDVLYNDDKNEVCVTPENGVAKRSEEWFCKSSGGRFLADVSAMPLYDDESVVIGVVVVFSDITKQKETEEILQASELEIRKLAMVAENTENGVIITNVNREIEWVNEAFTTMSGYSAQEVIGKKPAKLLQGKKTDMNNVLYMRHQLNAGKGFTLESINYRKDGSEYIVNFSVNPIRDKNGKLSGFFGMQSDITEKKQAEEELSKALKEAQSANVAKSEFLANMSHEIRTPLNGIMGFIALLAKATFLPQKEREYVWLIDKSSRNLLAIINDILDFSKVEANKLEINPHLHNAKADYAQTVNLFSSLAMEKNIKFLTFIDPNIPRLIIADSMRIRQILSNLLSNAIKFTPQDGCVTLRIETDECEDGKCKLSFTITDTGIGMEKETINKLFNQFSQADMTTSKEYGGTGLGLAISKSLAELMGSQIKVTSKVGKGSEFSFVIQVESHEPTRLVLPKSLRIAILTVSFCDEIGLFLDYTQAFGVSVSIIDKLDEEDSYDAVVVHIDELADFHIPFDVMSSKLIVISHYCQKVEPFTNMLSLPLIPLKIHDTICRITHIFNEEEQLGEADTVLVFEAKALVVDDNDVNRMLLSEVLHEYNISSMEARDGCEACEMVMETSFDIVFMDIHMPKCDGIVGLQKIREFESKNGLAKTPIIALTADAIMGKKEALLGQGFDAFITKPIEVRELEETLKQFLQVTQEYQKKETFRVGAAKEIVSPLENEYFSATKTANELGISQAGVHRSYLAFLRSLEETLIALDAACAISDTKAIRDLAHKIKGSSANLRIETITEPAKFIEESAGAEDFGLIETKIEEIKKIAKMLPQA